MEETLFIFIYELTWKDRGWRIADPIDGVLIKAWLSSENLIIQLAAEQYLVTWHKTSLGTEFWIKHPFDLWFNHKKVSSLKALMFWIVWELSRGTDSFAFILQLWNRSNLRRKEKCLHEQWLWPQKPGNRLRWPSTTLSGWGNVLEVSWKIQHWAHKMEISAVALINFARSNQYYPNTF